jgi:hypothetical protein
VCITVLNSYSGWALVAEVLLKRPPNISEGNGFFWPNDGYIYILYIIYLKKIYLMYIYIDRYIDICWEEGNNQLVIYLRVFLEEPTNWF